MTQRMSKMRSATFRMLISAVLCCQTVIWASGGETTVAIGNHCINTNAFRQVSDAVVACIDRAETNALISCFIDKRESAMRFLGSAHSNMLFEGYGWSSVISSLVITEDRGNAMSGRFHWRRMGVVPSMTVMGAVNEGVERNFACEVTLSQTNGAWSVDTLTIVPTGVSDEQLSFVQSAILREKGRLSRVSVTSQELESACSGIAYLHLSVGQTEEAVLAARQSVAASPNYISYFLLGRALKANRSWGAAHDAFMAASACVKEGMMQKDAVRQAMECSILRENERSLGK